MTTRVIYPRGVATGAGCDTDIIINAINGAGPKGIVGYTGGGNQSYANPMVEGDVLIMKKATQAGAATAWYLAKPITEGCPEALARTPARSPLVDGTTNFNAEVPWVNQQVAIGIDSKSIEIQGELDEPGNPATIVKGAVDAATFMTTLTSWWSTMWGGGDPTQYQQDGGMFVFGGQQQSTIRNIKFQWGDSYKIISCAGISVINCDFELCGGTWNELIYAKCDNRYTGFVDIKDCGFTNNGGYMDIRCGGKDVTVEGCDFHPLTDVWEDINDIWNLAPFIWSSIHCEGDGWYTPRFNAGSAIFYVPDNSFTVKNCTTDRTAAFRDHGPWVGIQLGIEGWGAELPVGVNAVIHDSVVDNCTFTEGEYYYAPVLLTNANMNNQRLESTSVVNCTFTSCGGNTNFGPAAGCVALAALNIQDCMVSNNTYTSVANSDGTHGPGVYMWSADNCQVVKDDFRNSGIATVTVNSSLTCVVMDSCNCCTVFESGMVPTGQGGPANFVTDINGYSNRLVGSPANHVEKPIGIGAAVRGARAVVMAQVETYKAHKPHAP